MIKNIYSLSMSLTHLDAYEQKPHFRTIKVRHGDGDIHEFGQVTKHYLYIPYTQYFFSYDEIGHKRSDSEERQFKDSFGVAFSSKPFPCKDICIFFLSSATCLGDNWNIGGKSAEENVDQFWSSEFQEYDIDLQELEDLEKLTSELGTKLWDTRNAFFFE